MTADESIHERLVGRYLDGLATEAELSQLDHVLRGSPAAADRLARAARLDVWLTDAFQPEARAADVRALVRRESEAAAGAGAGWRAAWWRPALAAAAAVILVAIAAGAWILWHTPQPAGNVVAEGTVLVGGRPVDRIEYGQQFEVAQGAAAVVRLEGGTRAALEPLTVGTVRPASDGLRPGVDLEQGKGAFKVEKGPGRFQVRTPVGHVTALGTEFRVGLLPGTVQEKGDRAMTARHMLLAVVVLAGVVQVDIGDQSYTLGMGESRVFAKDGEGGPKLKNVGGEIAKLEGNTITLIQRGDQGEKTVTITVDPNTKVLIESDQMESVPGEGGKTKERPKVIEGKLSDLKGGMRITAGCTEGGRAVKIMVARPKPVKREGGEGEGKPRQESPKQPREGGEGDRK